MLVKELDKYDLQREFQSYDRDYYSLDGYQAILDMFEELGGTQELDVIAICCDFNEEDEKEIKNNYGLDEDDNLERYLNNNTFAVKLDNGNYLYQTF